MALPVGISRGFVHLLIVLLLVLVPFSRCHVLNRDAFSQPQHGKGKGRSDE